MLKKKKYFLNKYISDIYQIMTFTKKFKTNSVRRLIKINKNKNFDGLFNSFI